MYRSIEEDNDKLRIKIYVKPSSSKEKLSLEGDELVFYATEPPIHGRANASLIKFFSKKLNISSSMISIKYGSRSKSKILEIYSEKPEEIVKKIKKLIVK